MLARDQFNRQAAHYDQQWAAWNQASLDWMIRHAGAEPHHRLLDVATGTGYTALGFAPLVRAVVGVDVSEGMLAQARSRQIPNATFAAGSAEALPFPAADFHLVTCRIAPHHFTSVPRFLSECHRVLQPGGRLLIADTTVPDGDPAVAHWQNQVERLRDPSHVENHAPAAWRQMTEAVGFQIELATTLAGTSLVSLNDWLSKAGCAGTKAQEVQRLFQEAPAVVRQHFQIEAAGDDHLFAWLRFALVASRPSRV